PEFCQQIKRPVIKGLRMQQHSDLGLLKAYQRACWRILLDTPTSQWGGTGETHDWTLARSVAQEFPILLAGGLTPENVKEAIQLVRPWGVDGRRDEEMYRIQVREVEDALLHKDNTV